MDLEDELNRLFKDERLDMRAAPDAETHVVAGAKRVRRRRVALMSAAGVLSAAVLAGGAFVLAQPGPQSSQVANQPSDLPVEISSSPSEAPPSSTTTEATSHLVAPPSTSRPASPILGTPRNPPAATNVPPIAPAANLGPRGFGKMVLGMTAEELLATGEVQGSPKPDSRCAPYSTRSPSGTVYVTKENGLVALIFNTGVSTPEHIFVGSTLDAVKAAYPDFAGTTAKVPGNPSAKFQFTISAGKVTQIGLLAAQQDCVS